MEWNEEVIQRLRALWDEGLSTAEIGRRLGVSKNAVVGKAHRLGLASRPSPIRKDPSGRPRPVPPRRVVGPTLPPLSTSLTSAPEIVAASPRPEPVVSVPSPILASVSVRRPGRAHVCCWPLGEPGTRSFRFCDGEALTGKPYCAEHAQLAYVKVRERHEDAA